MSKKNGRSAYKLVISDWLPSTLWHASSLSLVLNMSPGMAAFALFPSNGRVADSFPIWRNRRSMPSSTYQTVPILSDIGTTGCSFFSTTQEHEQVKQPSFALLISIWTTVYTEQHSCVSKEKAEKYAAVPFGGKRLRNWVS